MTETPEAIRERIHAEELSKGSDPRVAEARAKAAEMRARHGLPIDPQEAWRAKLAKEGGAPSEPAPKQPDTPPAPTEAPAAEAPAAEQEAPPAAEEAAEVVEPAPTLAAPAAQVSEPEAMPQPPAEPEVPFDPEIGEVIVEPQTVSEIGGVKVRDAPLPSWLMVALLSILVWATIYLLALGGEDVARRTSECETHADNTFECFLKDDAEKAPAGGH